MEIQIHRDFAASAQEVWAVVGERFGDLSWSSGIDRSSLEGELGVGAVRVCEAPPNMLMKDGIIRERLLTFDRDAMRLSYEAVDPPGVMKHAVNRWSVVALDGQRARVEMRASVEFVAVIGAVAWMFSPWLRRMGRQTLDELAEHLERSLRSSHRGDASGLDSTRAVPRQP